VKSKLKSTVILSSTTVQTRVQCNENSTRSYENLSVSKLVKTVINTAITVILLKSKVALLNTCEKLKMTHETQRKLVKSKVNETCYCENVTIRLKCESGCGTFRTWG
jgi:hypothetical protein